MTADERHLHAVPPEDDDGPTPPHNYLQEEAVLGACLLHKTDLDQVSQILEPGDFYRPANERIYAAILDLYARLQPVDALTVADHLGKNLERCGGHVYLAQLASSVAVQGNAPHYAEKLKKLAVGRHLVTAGMRQVQLGYAVTAETDIDHVLDDVEQRIQAIPRGVPGVDTPSTSSWAPVDLAELRANGLTRPTATLLVNNHGQGLIYPGRTHSISGESTTGKTWVTLAGLCQELEAGHPVTFIDFEDRADTLLTRLHDMGADPDLVDRHVRYIGPDKALDTAAWRLVETATKDCRIVIIDGVTEAMTMHGWSLLDNEDIARWYGLLPRRIAALGPGVMEIDHVVKDKESRGRYAIGGAHKLNGITGCAYSIIAGKSFAIGQQGHSKVIVAKDRHGNVGPVGHTAAEFHVTPDISRHREAMVWELTANQITVGASGRPRLTGYMEKVSLYLETAPGTSRRGITDAIKGKQEHLASAIESLIEEGYLRTEPGPRGAVFHFPVRPFRESDDALY